MDFSSLPPDVVYRILTSLPDFNTLSIALLTSKRLIYQLFQDHPVSITRAVAHNVVGPSLPQALTVLRMTGKTSGKLEDVPPETELINETFSRDMAWKLEENAKVAYGIEDLFSMKYKDRTCRTSQLTRKESARFLCALYRTWSIASLAMLKYDNREGHEDEYDDDEGVDVRCTRRVAPIILRQLQRFTNEEICEIYNISQFFYVLMQLATSQTHHCYSLEFTDKVLLYPPTLMWPMFSRQCYRGFQVYSSHIENYFVFGARMLNTAMGDIWMQRKVSEVVWLKSPSKVFVHTVEGAQDVCQCCNAVTGLDLWGRSNFEIWFRNRDIYDFSGSIFLPGLLSHNYFVTSWLNCLTDLNNHDCRKFNLGEMAEEIYAIAENEDGPGAWSRDAWYCTKCVDELFKRHFWRWILHSQKKRGETIKADCSYGYNCGDMAHKMVHAGELNHLCVPTRGDAE